LLVLKMRRWQEWRWRDEREVRKLMMRRRRKKKRAKKLMVMNVSSWVG